MFRVALAFPGGIRRRRAGRVGVGASPGSARVAALHSNKDPRETRGGGGKAGEAEDANPRQHGGVSGMRMGGWINPSVPPS